MTLCCIFLPLHFIDWLIAGLLFFCLALQLKYCILKYHIKRKKYIRYTCRDVMMKIKCWRSLRLQPDGCWMVPSWVLTETGSEASRRWCHKSVQQTLTRWMWIWRPTPQEGRLWCPFDIMAKHGIKTSSAPNMFSHKLTLWKEQL